MDMVGKGRAEQVKFGGPNSLQMLGARRLSREFGDIIDSVNAMRAEPMAIDKSWDVPANPLQPLLPQRPGELRRARTSRSPTSRSATRRTTTS